MCAPLPEGLDHVCPILQEGSGGNLKGTEQRHDERRGESNVKENFPLEH